MPYTAELYTPTRPTANLLPRHRVRAPGRRDTPTPQVWPRVRCAAGTDTAGEGQYQHAYTYDAIGNLTAMAGITYTYGISRPHAVTAVGTDSYQYDANGNMTVRVVGGITQTLTYDAQNRLVAVDGDGLDADFLYTADGERILSTLSGDTVAFIGGVYEWHGDSQSGVSYYHAGGGRVAVRQDTSVRYLLGDQAHSGAPGSTVLSMELPELSCRIYIPMTVKPPEPHVRTRTSPTPEPGQPAVGLPGPESVAPRWEPPPHALAQGALAQADARETQRYYPYGATRGEDAVGVLSESVE